MKKIVCALFVCLLGVALLAATYTDDFNRADSGTLGANWTDAGAGLQIISNKANGDTGGSNGVYEFAWYDNGAFNNDQSSEATLGQVSTMNAAWLIVRATGTSLATLDGYGMLLYKPDPQIVLYKLVDGDPQQIEQWEIPSTFSDGQVYKLTVVGTTLRGYRNGSELPNSPATDATYSSGAAGIGLSADDTDWDDWTGADIGGGGGAMPCFRSLLGVGC